MVVQEATVLSPGTKSMLQKLMGAGRGRADEGRGPGRGKGKKAGGGGARRQQTDVSAGRKRWVPSAALRRVS